MKQKKSPGGRREGAGRRAGTGKYGEETKPIRVPVSLLSKVYKMLYEHYEEALEKRKDRQGEAIGSQGGKMRADKLTAEQKKEIALKAAKEDRVKATNFYRN